MQAYSNPKRESDPHSLPDIEVFELTAEEAVQQDEDLMGEAGKKFPLMHINSRDRDISIEESGTTGGWFWWSCSPGCLPDGCAIGPFKTSKEALEDARQGVEDDTEDEEN
jgi:hypothetical protein